MSTIFVPIMSISEQQAEEDEEHSRAIAVGEEAWEEEGGGGGGGLQQINFDEWVGEVIGSLTGLHEYFVDIPMKLGQSFEHMSAVLDRRYSLMWKSFSNAKSLITNFTEKLRSLEQQLLGNKQLRNLLKECTIVQDFSQLLQNNVGSITSQIDDAQKTLAQIQEVYLLRKSRLDSLNKDNLLLSTQITKIERRLKESKAGNGGGKNNLKARTPADDIANIERYCGVSHTSNGAHRKQLNTAPHSFRNTMIARRLSTPEVTPKNLFFSSTTNNGFRQMSGGDPQSSEGPKEEASLQYEQQDMLRNIQREISQVKQSNENMRGIAFQRKIAVEARMKLMKASIQTHKNVLQSREKVATNGTTGLAGSLLFQLTKLKRAQAQPFTSEFSLQSYPLSQYMDRESRVVVHETLRSMVEKRCLTTTGSFRNQQQVSTAASQHGIDSKTFQKFTPMQIIGLMSLLPKSFEMMVYILESQNKRVTENLFAIDRTIEQGGSRQTSNFSSSNRI